MINHIDKFIKNDWKSILEKREKDIAEGDEIFLYTDGVTEATNTVNELYGEDRLITMMNKVTEKSVESQVTDVLGDINKFVGAAEQFDDITMMGMRILEK